MATQKGMKQTDMTVATVLERTAELQVGAEASGKEQEIKAMVVIAKRFPRDEEASFRALMTAAERMSFAEEAAYSFPRGTATVTGPSIVLAREAARLWGNIKSGLLILRDDAETRLIRGFAWDMQTNAYAEFEDDFKKVVYRKEKGWIVPDERDLRELTNRRGAILMRNCILALLPKDRIDEVLAKCGVTMKASAKKEPTQTMQKAIEAFWELGVTQVMLEKKLGHPFAACSPEELAELRRIYKSISDGNTTWTDYVHGAGPSDEQRDEADAARLKATQEALADDREGAKPAPLPEIDDARWERIAEYLDSDLSRQQVKKAVKQHKKVAQLSDVQGLKRLEFVSALVDFAHRAKVTLELPA